ncbi:hypothetical protein [Ascidiimonas sp. W6]|uniref:hypothetical protein n=1 Tax=Ascidiimonas meishanensis TaxID=3128903 RepID=UPI0030EF4483
MEFKSPKVLEKEPEVMGFSMLKVAIIVGCGLGFLFTVFTKFYVSLIFVAFAGIYFGITFRFPGKGELSQFIKYNTSSHCIKHDVPLKQLIRTKTDE